MAAKTIAASAAKMVAFIRDSQNLLVEGPTIGILLFPDNENQQNHINTRIKVKYKIGKLPKAAFFVVEENGIVRKIQKMYAGFSVEAGEIG